jgi:hypothetical protein
MHEREAMHVIVFSITPGACIGCALLGPFDTRAYNLSFLYFCFMIRRYCMRTMAALSS